MSEPMTFEEALRTKLAERLGPVYFSDMRAHLERDAVILIAPALPLLDAAVAVANDDAERVGRWIADGTMRKPSRRERDAWPTEEGRTWLAVVVQPFVLVQDSREIN
jgi:hypothetical protein